MEPKIYKTKDNKSLNRITPYDVEVKFCERQRLRRIPFTVVCIRVFSSYILYSIIGSTKNSLVTVSPTKQSRK